MIVFTTMHCQIDVFAVFNQVAKEDACVTTGVVAALNWVGDFMKQWNNCMPIKTLTVATINAVDGQINITFMFIFLYINCISLSIQIQNKQQEWNRGEGNKSNG